MHSSTPLTETQTTAPVEASGEPIRTMFKIVTFGIPCYNSASDMDRSITSILEGSGYAPDVEIIIVDDGSVDETPAKADDWARRYPGLIRVVHQENGGHGTAVLTGLREATGVYYKVVDSDDWLDGQALATMLSILRGFVERDTRVDLFISNYVYEKVHEGTHTTIDYRFAIPRKKILTWNDVGHFRPDQHLLMHSLCYRTDVLRAGDLPLPPHTFYVDNIYAYVPLPRCKTLYYADIDLYRYFIGREGQSVNESTMIKRIDQQFRITRIMMKAYHLYDDIEEKPLASCMMGYFTMMMVVCSIFSKLAHDKSKVDEVIKIWAELKAFDKKMYNHARWGLLGFWTNLPTPVGEKVSVGLYRAAQKIFKFN